MCAACVRVCVVCVCAACVRVCVVCVCAACVRVCVVCVCVCVCVLGFKTSFIAPGNDTEMRCNGMPVTLDACHSLHIHSTVTFRSMLWH